MKKMYRSLSNTVVTTLDAVNNVALAGNEYALLLHENAVSDRELAAIENKIDKAEALDDLYLRVEKLRFDPTSFGLPPKAVIADQASDEA